MDTSILVGLLNCVQDDDIIDKQIIRNLYEVLQTSKSCSHAGYSKNYSGCKSQERGSSLSNSSIFGNSSADMSLNSTQLLQKLQKQTLQLNETRIYMKELIVELLQNVSTESLNEVSMDFTNDSQYRLRQLVDASRTKIKIVKSLRKSINDHIRIQQDTNNLLNKVFLLQDRATN